jgi:exosortase/archaeosortase family protein
MAALCADFLAAPVLFTTSPVWATLCALLLVWRRGNVLLEEGDGALRTTLSISRITSFVVCHLVYVVSVRALSASLSPVVGGLNVAGWILAALKLGVLLPTFILLPSATWKSVSRTFSAEAIASLVVLLTFFPRRILETIWPVYGQILARVVSLLAHPFVPSLTYVAARTPILQGPALNVTILEACSGLNGLELFDYLFAMVVLCDWNRLNKGRALVAYFAGTAAMILANALRIASLVVFGNRGFTDIVIRFHISAGWVFFSFAFLIFLTVTYRWMLLPRQRN